MVEHIGNVGGTGNVLGHKLTKIYETPKVERGNDKVDISADVKSLQGIDPARMDKIMTIRMEIQNGTYDTPEKLN